MVDPKGFLRYPRRTRPRRPPEERAADWHEVYAGQELLPVVTGQVREQARRCMDCGVPFCHSGCPLGNLIPEWNEYAAQGDWRAAADRLHATNNFPEFTGRLCPAPCEDACVLAINADPVTIKDVEVTIADQAWELGLAPPRPPHRLSGRTVAVVGSGPAGLAAAQQLTRAGHTVAVYERDDRIGGLLRYGIPEFKMEKRHINRRIEQMRAEGTKFRTGVEIGRDVDAAELRGRYDAVVLAVGATEPRELPVPGRELGGIHQAMYYLPLANRVQEGDYDASPLSAEGRHVVIVGGGDTGSDCLGTAIRQRATSVTQLDIRQEPGPERPEDDPWPVTHPKVYRISHAHEEARSGAGGADPRVFAATTLRFEGDGRGNVRSLRLAEVEPADRRRHRPGTERVIPAELVLLALGFSGPERDGGGGGLIGQLGLSLDGRGNLARDAGFTTAADGVFVAGDAGRGQSLIVWAIAEGRSAAAAVDRYLSGATSLPAPVAPTDRPLTA
ncbi:glutamate synthase subunit beta [Streptomyces pathocidini]|uniref:Glutamate synthase subunit beta n=1 Tax=Streptomyces pathocidini TaxID=1650571 RepID=A0ABW7UYC9_9ACTN